MKIDWNRKYTTIAVYAVLGAAAVLLIFFTFLNFNTVLGWLDRFNQIMSPVYLGLILAYLFNPILKMCEKRIFRFKITSKRKWTLKRVLGLTLTYIIILIILTITFLLIIPQLFVSFNDLASKMNGYIDDTLEWINEFLSTSPIFGSDINNIDDALEKLLEFLDITTDTIYTKVQELVKNSSALLTDYVPMLFDYFTGIANGFINTILGIIFSVYFLASKEKLVAQCKKVLRSFVSQEHYNGLLELANYTDKTFGGYITGKIIDSLIIGVLCYIACLIFDMPYALLLSTFIAITNIIPVVGPFIGAIPGVFIIFIIDPRKAFWFIVINIVLQQLDGNVICPKILGDSTGLSALWVLVSITVMGGMWGLLGMLLSVPVFAILYTLVKMFIEKRLKRRALPTETRDYYADVEERNYGSDGDDDQHTFAASLSQLTAEIAENHFGKRIKSLTQKLKSKRVEKKADKSADSDQKNSDNNAPSDKSDNLSDDTGTNNGASTNDDTSQEDGTNTDK